MEPKQSFLIEKRTPFSKSLIWQLNRDYYIQKGLDAWIDGTVPHYLTSNSMVGGTYSDLIFAMLKDLAAKEETEKKVYILELGAGHGRLCFHILKHLDNLINNYSKPLPPYCYILSDIAEKNLDFFIKNEQFHPYIKAGKLDIAYFDAIDGENIFLRHAKKEIKQQSLDQVLVVLANYFFDSIPSDLFLFQNEESYHCSVELTSKEDPEGFSSEKLLQNIETKYFITPVSDSYFKNPSLNKSLAFYREQLKNSFLFFPDTAMRCIKNLQNLSTKGIMLISMDKGFHELSDLENITQPEMIVHGSMSFWVNYHALGRYCEDQGGSTLFPKYSTFHLELACMLFMPESNSYSELLASFDRNVNDFGPDDFNGFKQSTYKNMHNMSLVELIGVLRLSAYDSTIFVKVLPRIKELCKNITMKERHRLAQTMEQTWEMYFNLSESLDLAFEIGGVCYDLGFYKVALGYFDKSIALYDNKPDAYYNKIMCHYQNREDKLLLETIKIARSKFPDFEPLSKLDQLDLTAL